MKPTLLRWIKPRHGFDMILSCTAASILLCLAKQPASAIEQEEAEQQEAVKESRSTRDGAITALGSLIGSDEVACSEGLQNSNASSVTSSWMEVTDSIVKYFVEEDVQARHSSCPHPGPCFKATFQSFLRPLALGAVGQALIYLLARSVGTLWPPTQASLPHPGCEADHLPAAPWPCPSLLPPLGCLRELPFAPSAGS